jgi:hypothetical protein
MKQIVVVALAMLATAPALACDPSQHRDLVRAQERQADSLRQIERHERERNKMLDRQQRNANR